MMTPPSVDAISRGAPGTLVPIPTWPAFIYEGSGSTPPRPSSLMVSTPSFTTRKAGLFGMAVIRTLSFGQFFTNCIPAVAPDMFTVNALSVAIASALANPISATLPLS